MRTGIIIATLFIFLSTEVCLALYFPIPVYNVKIPPNLQKNSNILKVFAVQDGDDVGNVTYKLEYIPQIQRLSTMQEMTGQFSIRPSTGWIYLARETYFPDGLKGTALVFNMNLTAQCMSRMTGQKITAVAKVKVHLELDDIKVSEACHSTIKRLKQRFCFDDGPSQYHILENGTFAIFTRFRSAFLARICPRWTTTYSILADYRNVKAAAIFSIANSTSEMMVTRALDCEKEENDGEEEDDMQSGSVRSYYKFTVVCTIRFNGRTRAITTKPISVNIGDINDNEPLFYIKGKPQKFQESDIPPLKNRWAVVVSDRDRVGNDNYTFKIENDKENLFEIRKGLLMQGTKNQFIVANVVLRNGTLKKNLKDYSITVVFNDTTLRVRPGETAKRLAKARLNFSHLKNVPKTNTRAVDQSTFPRQRAPIVSAPVPVDRPMPKPGSSRTIVDRPVGRRVGDFDGTLDPYPAPDPQKFSAPKISLNKAGPTVFNSAARYSRVYDVGKLTKKKYDKRRKNFQILGTGADIDGSNLIFGITPRTGTIYIKNDVSLRNMKTPTTYLWVNVTDGTVSEDIMVSVMFTDDTEVYIENCEVSCSAFQTRDSCETDCGYGAKRGRCMIKDGLESGLSTCTPSATYCPDGVCDELEELFPKLCPQDCAKPSKNDDSDARRNSSDGCRCYEKESCNCVTCECGDDPITTTSTASPLSIPPVAVRYNVPSFDENGSFPASGSSLDGDTLKNYVNHDNCDKTCKTVIGLCIGSVFMLILVGVLAYMIHMHRVRKAEDMKHVSSAVSLNAIPSDYIEPRTDHAHQHAQEQTTELQPSSNSLAAQSLEWTAQLISQGVPTDPKWEFPRKNLVLRCTLGEGEFGTVVQADAYGLNGPKSHCIVAVKMLKSCATMSEFRDLLSEYNLLKDVSHPNVIKLLGACTNDGPLYLIVEHCEHGSLRSYLRKNRNVEFLYMGKRSQPLPPDAAAAVANGQISDYIVTSRDLISFAWQIAKGMQYLSEMKLVHRDLAARNVLVASMKKVKISDFGLTRDIYEADAYTKKSKGRIPVKWMAPESLYDQIYTAKSDVWSYGVVLWEIATLGATPYPGIPPERLYNILKTGYRMERPANCGEKLYSIMVKCWSTAPSERTPFSELVKIFDSLLQDNVDYLDLVGAAERNPIVDDKDQEVSTERVTNSEPIEETEELDYGEYGNISILSLDANSYLSPNARSREDYENDLSLDEIGSPDGEMTRLLVLDMPRENHVPVKIPNGDLVTAGDEDGNGVEEDDDDDEDAGVVKDLLRDEVAIECV
ncbi:proto-oncogene tyrosine-protein kinase receptor Ret-like [Tubulanus polymorphus]|uniref:proto-oncogene tyrosine-protein kinase receptor Ret-like n=1 Tax=Tubulanus polymorphus TaxID=672921 RepID=UPI003DA533FB